MNKVILIGRTTKTPELREGNSIFCRFTLAVDRKKKDEQADFINCVAFGKQAEFVAKYFPQGKKMALEGRIQTGSYTNRDGKKITTTDVIVENVEFVEKRELNEPTTEPTYAQSTFVPVDELADAGLPFN